MRVFVLLVTGIWIGMIVGISFVEAPLKFRAPEITLKIALGIGELVFSALNKFELLFSATLLLWLVREGKNLELWTVLFLAIPILLVAAQSLWLLPELNIRVNHIRSGLAVRKSHLHFYYVIMEVTKVCFLTVGFIQLYPHE